MKKVGSQSEPAKSKSDDFVRHLEKTTETVRSWPKWKQNLMGAATPEQRKTECFSKGKKG